MASTTFIPRGFYEKEWLDIIKQYEKYKNLKEVTDRDWEGINNILQRIVTGKIGSKTGTGAHSNKYLGAPTKDYYTQEILTRFYDGIRTWDVAVNNLIVQLQKIAYSIIRNKYEQYKKLNKEEKLAKTYDKEIIEEITPSKGELDRNFDSETYIKQAEEYIVKLFEGDPHLVKYATLRLEGLSREEIKEEFDNNIKLVDNLSKRFNRKVRTIEVKKKLDDILYALQSDLNAGRIRLLDEIFIGIEPEKDEFVRQINDWFKQIEEWLSFEDFKIASKIYKINPKHYSFGKNDLYAVKLEYDNKDKVFILIMDNSDLVGLQIHDVEFSKEEFQYESDNPVDKTTEKYLIGELKEFKKNPYK